MRSVAARFSLAPTITKLSLSGLGVGVLGLIVQWIADPAEFPVFPPGIVFIVGCAALVVLASGRWWAPIFAVLIAVWIVLGGWAAGQLIPNFTSGDAGTAVGTAVMTLGLAFAAITGVLAMRTGRKTREDAVAR